MVSGNLAETSFLVAKRGRTRHYLRKTGPDEGVIPSTWETRPTNHIILWYLGYGEKVTGISGCSTEKGRRTDRQTDRAGTTPRPWARRSAAGRARTLTLVERIKNMLAELGAAVVRDERQADPHPPLNDGHGSAARFLASAPARSRGS